MKKTLDFVIILLFGIYIAVLYINNELLAYIHPRYVNIALASGIVAIIAGVVGLFAGGLKNIKNSQPSFRLLVEYSPLILALGMAMLLPVKPLSAATALQRNQDLNTSFQATTTNTQIQQYFGDTSNYSLGDWVNMLNQGADIKDLVGKEVKVTGFIFQDLNYPADTFVVARFVITCCAVDARPVGLDVQYDWQNNFKQDDWVEVTGKFEIRQINEAERLVIIPEQMNKIEQPEQPYIY